MNQFKEFLRERVIIGGDLNGHVGKDSEGYETVHRGCRFRSKCDSNTYLKKREKHLVTF